MLALVNCMSCYFIWYKIIDEFHCIAPPLFAGQAVAYQHHESYSGNAYVILHGVEKHAVSVVDREQGPHPQCTREEHKEPLLSYLPGATGTYYCRGQGEIGSQ